MTTPVLVLVHSPLVGPSTWLPVAEALRARGLATVAPRVSDRGEALGPYWRQHALSVAAVLQALPAGRQVVLVGHSGAGPLLPAMREQGRRDVAAYMFVDAGIPEDGLSRIELLRRELPEVAPQLAAHLEAGGRFPEWTDADLAEAVPDAARRRQLLAELQPRGLPFWQEPIPVFRGWPDAACAYLRLSEGYRAPAERARQDGWASAEMDGSHFQMLIDPGAVADAMLDLMRAVGMPAPAGGPGR
jgi:pimeloyl-ACP methyl ester carboxylesterase